MKVIDIADITDISDWDDQAYDRLLSAVELSIEIEFESKAELAKRMLAMDVDDSEESIERDIICCEMLSRSSREMPS